MKVIPLMAILIMAIGCSHDFGANPQLPATANDATWKVSPDVADEQPVTDIEPELPLCEVERFGYIKLSTPSLYPVRCRIGGNLTVTVRPGRTTQVQASMGTQSLEWWPTETSHYTTSVIVSVCKSVESAFDPAHPCEYRHAQ